MSKRESSLGNWYLHTFIGICIFVAILIVANRYITSNIKSTHEYLTVTKTYTTSSGGMFSSDTNFIAVAESEDSSINARVLLPQGDWEMLSKGDIIPVTIFKMPHTSVRYVLYGHTSIKEIPRVRLYEIGYRLD